MPADNRPRRITIINAPYNYYFKDRSAVVCFRETGEVLVKAEIAEAALNSGYAIEGWASDSKARTTKGKTPRRKSVKPAVDAGANTRSSDSLGGGSLATDDSAEVGQPLADTAD